MADEKIEQVEETAREFDELANEGEDLPEEKPAEGAEEPDEGGEEETSANDEVSARLEALENKLAERDAEIQFLRGEVSKRTTPVVNQDEAPLFDEDELAAKLTDKNPKVGVKTLIDLATKIADTKIAAERAKTASMVRDSDEVRSAKEQDRNRVMEDFTEELADPRFMDTMRQIFKGTQAQVGGRYLRDSLYQAAASAKVMLDKVKAQQRGTRNGVTEVRPQRESRNTTTSSTADYANVTTIGQLPDSEYSPREKAAMRAVAKRMGMTEKQWVENLRATQQENA